MELHRQCRFDTVDDIFGNDSVKAALSSFIHRKEGIPHTILFHGPKGCGKTSMARLLSKELGCEDLREIDVGDFTGIDSAREVRAGINYMPLKGDSTVWIMDEAHRLTSQAQQALLKSFEEPPDHVYFFLATTEPTKLLPTVRNRFQEVRVKELSEDNMYDLVTEITTELDICLSEPAVDAVVEASSGVPRTTLMLIDRIKDLPLEEQVDIVGSEEEKTEAIRLCRTLMKRNVAWKDVAKVLKELKDVPPEKLRRLVLSYCSSVLMNGNEKGYAIMEAFEVPFEDIPKVGLQMACYRAIA